MYLLRHLPDALIFERRNWEDFNVEEYLILEKVNWRIIIKNLTITGHSAAASDPSAVASTKPENQEFRGE